MKADKSAGGWLAPTILAAWSLLAAVGGATNPASAQTLDSELFRSWGVETALEIDATLKLPGQALYAETAHSDGTRTGGWNGTGFAWPHSAQFRVLNDLVRIDSRTYVRQLRQFSDQFHNAFWSPDGGYYCCRGGGDRFYDDNAHIAVALAEAYLITGAQVYLDRAEATFDFLLTGEAPRQNGGSYWSVADHSFLDSAAALQGARAALMLYQATGNAEYIEHAQRRYGWARDVTQVADGTFMEKLFLTGDKAGQIGNYTLVQFAGYGISTNTLFYDVTGDEAYLDEAQRIARTTLRKFFDASTGRINDEGFWAYELVDGLIDLYQRDNNAVWLNHVVGALEWLHENKEDPQGHYPRFWGREGPQVGTLDAWDLNDQAPVARGYLQASLAQRAPVGAVDSADFDFDGDVDAEDFLTWQRHQGLTDQPYRSTGDANDDGWVTAADLEIWQAQMGRSSDGPFTAIPEPGAWALFALAAAICAGVRK
ncbi:MAG: AGE family epimerase/isomerase [Planctomycetales bacterium]|nr:AGE family epimerase/isomerase [Planctomycetales bacterium]